MYEDGHLLFFLEKFKLDLTNTLAQYNNPHTVYINNIIIEKCILTTFGFGSSEPCIEAE